MSGITTHVLDTSRGSPASGVPVSLSVETGDTWRLVRRATTDSDGRATLAGEGEIAAAGRFRIRFEVEGYLTAHAGAAFYPRVDVVFSIADPSCHHHVPLLLSPFGYSTYRGS